MRIPLTGRLGPRRVHTRARLQTESVECGAAALGIVLEYHGKYESAARLRELCEVSRGGAGAGAILRTAREFGLDARAFSCEVEDLRRLQPPFVVFWNFDHYVVIEGFRGRRVYLNDPASGRTAVSPDEFDRGFTGVVFTFQKSGAFRKSGARPSCVRSLLRRLEGRGLAVTFVVLSTLALLLPSMAAGLLPKILFDAVLTEGAAHWLKPLLFGMTAGAAALSALTLLQQRALASVETGLASASAARFFWHLLHLPTSFFSRRRSGELADCIAANDRLAGLLAGDVATSVIHAALAGLYLAMMARYDARLAAVVAAFAVVNVVVLYYASRSRSQDSCRIARERGRTYALAVGGLSGIETIKAMGSESEFFNAWAGSYGGLLSFEQRMQRSNLLLGSVSPLLSSVALAAVLGLGGGRIMEGYLTLGMLIAFQTLTTSFLEPLQRLMQMGSKLQQIEGDVARLDEILENSPVERSPAAPANAVGRRLTGNVELRSITFGYDSGAPVLVDFNLSIPAGSRIALTGSSGSGKSTVAKLLTGLYRPSGGQILFDGVPRERLPREVLQHSIAAVDQEISLFTGSIAENIALMDDTLPREALVSAARDAAIHDEIEAMPNGYGHRIEDGGRNFSYGQRQRIEIARALAVDPRVLILDEATSALDPITEKTVLDSLRRRGCTCIVVAHRLSAIRDCDEIVVLERGRVAERGTHEQLALLGGRYATLIAE
jgi:NHLM bacteriocin system ABC transporter peptidase/ATP-binding protein